MPRASTNRSLLHPDLLSRHSCAPSVIPAPLPSFLRRQEPSPASPPPVHPSPLSQGGGQVGGGMPRASTNRSLLHPDLLSRHPCAPSVIPAPHPSFLRRQKPSPTSPPSSPIHPSPLLGGRLGRWGVECRASTNRSLLHPHRLSRHSCVSRNPRARRALPPPKSPAALKHHSVRPSGRRGAYRCWRPRSFLPTQE